MMDDKVSVAEDWRTWLRMSAILSITGDALTLDCGPYDDRMGRNHDASVVRVTELFLDAVLHCSELSLFHR